MRRWQSWLNRLAIRVLDRAQIGLSTMEVSLTTSRGEARFYQAKIYKKLHGCLFPACPAQAFFRNS
eukprot:2445330-Pyramimonas_sp.AAC.1